MSKCRALSCKATKELEVCSVGGIIDFCEELQTHTADVEVPGESEVYREIVEVSLGISMRIVGQQIIGLAVKILVAWIKL